MENEKGILLFSSRAREKDLLSNLITSEGCTVFEASSALQALSILQKEDIGMIITDMDMEGIPMSEFKSLTEKIKPGVTMLFMGQIQKHNDGELSIEAREFLKLIREQTKSLVHMRNIVDELKQFSFSIIDRLLQIFEVNETWPR